MENKNHILLIVNPISGNTDKNELIDTVRKETDKRNLSMAIYKTTGNNDDDSIEKLIDTFDPDRILVAGGDGTIRQVADILKGHNIPIGIIPAGSANGLAVNLEIPKTLPEQLEVALGESLIKIDLLSVNDHTTLHIADMGINAELIKNYENSKMHGKLGYLLQCIPTLVDCEYPFDFEVTANGETFCQEGVLLAIANANKFGTGANINPTGKMNDGKFEVLIFKNLDLIQIFKTLYGEMDMDSDFVRMICTDHAKISCKNKTGLQIDGEYLGEVDSLEAFVSSKNLEIAVPASFQH